LVTLATDSLSSEGIVHYANLIQMHDQVMAAASRLLQIANQPNPGFLVDTFGVVDGFKQLTLVKQL
jgi:hypothetical protein